MSERNFVNVLIYPYSLFSTLYQTLIRFGCGKKCTVKALTSVEVSDRRVFSTMTKVHFRYTARKSDLNFSSSLWKPVEALNRKLSQAKLVRISSHERRLLLFLPNVVVRLTSMFFRVFSHPQIQNITVFIKSILVCKQCTASLNSIFFIFCSNYTKY